MTGIGGNIEAHLQIATSDGFNSIGERVSTWTDIKVLKGFLDLSNGDAKYGYLTKVQDSTHIFIGDYVPIDRHPENKRLLVNGEEFDVLLIDDPMELHEQLEIYLKYVGTVI